MSSSVESKMKINSQLYDPFEVEDKEEVMPGDQSAFSWLPSGSKDIMGSHGAVSQGTNEACNFRNILPSGDIIPIDDYLKLATKFSTFRNNTNTDSHDGNGSYCFKDVSTNSLLEETSPMFSGDHLPNSYTTDLKQSLLKNSSSNIFTNSHPDLLYQQKCSEIGNNFHEINSLPAENCATIDCTKIELEEQSTLPVTSRRSSKSVTRERRSTNNLRKRNYSRSNSRDRSNVRSRSKSKSQNRFRSRLNCRSESKSRKCTRSRSSSNDTRNSSFRNRRNLRSRSKSKRLNRSRSNCRNSRNFRSRSASKRLRRSRSNSRNSRNFRSRCKSKRLSRSRSNSRNYSRNFRSRSRSKRLSRSRSKSRNSRNFRSRCKSKRLSRSRSNSRNRRDFCFRSKSRNGNHPTSKYNNDIKSKSNDEIKNHSRSTSKHRDLAKHFTSKITKINRSKSKSRDKNQFPLDSSNNCNQQPISGNYSSKNVNHNSTISTIKTNSSEIITVIDSTDHNILHGNKDDGKNKITSLRSQFQNIVVNKTTVITDGDVQNVTQPKFQNTFKELISSEDTSCSKSEELCPPTDKMKHNPPTNIKSNLGLNKHADNKIANQKDYESLPVAKIVTQNKNTLSITPKPELISIQNALSFLDEIANSSGVLGSALKTVVNDAQMNLPCVTKALKSFLEKDIRILIEMCIDKLSLKALTDNSVVEYHRKAKYWAHMLFQMAEESEKESNLLVHGLDIFAIAKLTLGKATKETIEFIKNMLIYNGVTVTKAAVSEIYKAVSSQHLNLLNN